MLKIIIANFKAELWGCEIVKWLNCYIAEYSKFKITDKLIILCPSIPYLPFFKEELKKAQIPNFLGAQDLSRFNGGKYTGEVTAKMLKEFCDYVILGHSERREFFQEEPVFIQKKIYAANEAGLKIILCLESPETYTGEIEIAAYEPRSAIGTGNPEDPVKSYQICLQSTAQLPVKYRLYGGSVNTENVHHFIKAGFNGVLVGKSCLNPAAFLTLASNA